MTHRDANATTDASNHSAEPRRLRIGVDVGGTFTDLVAWDGHTLTLAKVPSTPPHFEQGVAAAVASVVQPGDVVELVHGSTVATNALLERRFEPVAFITTEGFGDLLHIGRQNRPQLYALHVQRPAPIIGRDHCFTVPERISPDGETIIDLDEAAVERVAEQILALGLRQVAICCLFSFANPEHERRIADICRRHGLQTTLSSDVLPEFREYERASTTAVTAALRPTVERYLGNLRSALPGEVSELRILHGGGGTYPVEEAAAHAGRLILSGPAGGVAGAALMARLAGVDEAVGFDMGGTSTDVALIRNGQPQTTHEHRFDGIPVHLPMFDIHTVGAGGGSIAFADPGGSLRVGPRSAGAQPGPACYARGGTEPTVTDASVVLGRIPTNARFGNLQLQPDMARQAVRALADQLRLSLEQTALGILKVAEGNMANAVRAVTARRGHDPRRMALISFGGAGGLHACGVAELLGMTRVLLPPMAGVLSALGMVSAADSIDVSQTTLQLERAGKLDDDRLYAEFGRLNAVAMDRLPVNRTARHEAYADCRWRGQSHELTVPVTRPSRQIIAEAFAERYRTTYGDPPSGAELEIVTLRLRRIGHAPALSLPPLERTTDNPDEIELVDQNANLVRARSTGRAPLLDMGEAPGPLLLLDSDATAFIPAGWSATCTDEGLVIARRHE